MDEQTWTPRSSDLGWTITTLSLLKIGGLWGTSYYTIEKISETDYVFVTLNKEHNDFEFQYAAIKKVMGALGWKLTDSENIS